jgi:DNA-binding transcriptional LysR family regulator
VLAHYAAQVLGVLDEARGAVQEAARPERGRIRLAAVMTVGEYVVPGMIRQFAARHPEVEFVLEVGNRRLVWDRLREHEADLAMSARPAPGERFVAEPFLRLERVVVASPSLHVPARLRAEDLASLTWLVREPGAGSTAAAEDFLARTGVAPRTLSLGSNAAIIESVALGLGVSLMPLDAVRREIDAGRLTTLPVAGIPKPDSWYVLRRSGEELPGAAGLFLEFVRRLGTAAVGEPPRAPASV